MAGKSGSQIGAENVERLRAYLDHVGAAIPRRAGGDPDITAIATGAGLARGVLYKNDACRKMLDTHLLAMGLDGPASHRPEHVTVSGTVDEEKRALQRRCKELEARVHGLLAEVADLRQQARRQGLIDDHLAATGRLVR